MFLWVEAIKLSKKLFRLPTYLLAKRAKSAWHRLGKVPGTDWGLARKWAPAMIPPVDKKWAVLFGDGLWSYGLRPTRAPRLPTYLLAKMAKSAWHRLGNCWLGCCLRGGALQSHQFLSDGSVHHLQQLRQGLTGKVAVNDSVIAKHGDQDLASVVDRSVGEAAG